MADNNLNNNGLEPEDAVDKRPGLNEGDRPFSAPDDVPASDGSIDDTHPATDSNIDETEAYNEGLAGAAEVEEP